MKTDMEILDSYRRKRDVEKQKMFDMLIDLDFSNEVSIKKLIELPYEIDDEDEELALNP